MVGRGGRSKGCNSCRQRHLKCDQATPQCQRCRRDMFECQYPAAKFINVFQKPAHENKRGARRQTLARKTLGSYPDETVVVTHLKRTIFATPADDPGWPGFQALVKNDGNLALRCLLSLSESYYGTVHHDARTARKGQSQYVDCLRQVNDRLSIPEDTVTSDTLLAVTILSAYEMLFCTVPNGWINHALGLAKLFEIAGPDVCLNDTTFDIYRGMRFVMVLSAIVTSTPTFLHKAEWKFRPWEARGMPKNDMDLLHDIFADLPSLRCYPEPQHDSPEALAAVFASSLDILARLRQWIAKWQPHSGPTLLATSSAEADFPKPWSFDFSHVSLYAANCFCLYNTALIIATQAALMTAQPGDMKPGDASVHLAIARQAGFDICRSIDDMLFRSQGTLGHLSILVPVQKAYEVLGKGTSPEGRWLEHRHQQIMSWTGSWRVSSQVLTGREEHIRVLSGYSDQSEDGV